MTIDMHAHWVPPALSAALRARAAAPRIRRTEAGVEMLDNGGARLIRLPEGFEDDIAARLAEMDRTGISIGLLSLATQYHVEWLPAAESVPLCRLFNDAVSQACAAHPSRFRALALLPATDIEAAREEFERAMRLPGMVGALLIGDGFLSKQRARRYAPIFEAANRRRAILFIHYGHLPDDPEAPHFDMSDNIFVRTVTLDFQARLSASMVTFCLTDFLAAYPDVTVLSHNLGGNIPFEIERMDHRAIIAEGPGKELPSARFRATPFLVDCNSLGARAIELATEVFGEDKIVFGSDGTLFGAQWSFDAVAKARIPDSAKQAILLRNAQAAFDRVRQEA
jgi:predicted TIM-barrel fold metal-dependent hydrolase